MAKARLETRLTATPPIPEAAVEAVTEVLRSGDLFRYAPGPESGKHAAAFEREFAGWCGRKYAIGLNSCGSTMFVALKALGVRDQQPVLFNAFTLAPVPGAIDHAGGRAVPVDCGGDLLVDLGDLERKAEQTGAKVFLLSHMRGHIADMGRVRQTCERLGLALIEDCAHTMGASWDGQLTGTFGVAGCFSTQSYKHLNSGEGGVLVTDDEQLAAHAILRSGSYALYEDHGARPSLEVFEAMRTSVPNCSLRMSNLVAALLRPQLAALPHRCDQWRRMYARIEAGLRGTPRLVLVDRDPREQHVPSSLQFGLPALTREEFGEFLSACAARGLPLQAFHSTVPVGFVGRCEHWDFVDGSELAQLPSILDRLVDFRLPLTFDEHDCDISVTIITETLQAIRPD